MGRKVRCERVGSFERARGCSVFVCELASAHWEPQKSCHQQCSMAANYLKVCHGVLEGRHRLTCRKSRQIRRAGENKKKKTNFSSGDESFFSYIGQIEITSPLRVFKGRFRGRWVSRCMRHATAKFGSLVHRFGMISVGSGFFFKSPPPVPAPLRVQGGSRFHSPIEIPTAPF